MNLRDHLDKDNLHHAYLIEGAREKIVPALIEFLEEIGVPTVGNADFIRLDFDSFKIDDARQLKSYSSEKSQTGKRIFIITANSFLLEAQNSLLKIFEEPVANTHFFLVVPDVNALLRTVVSRFFLIKPEVALLSDLEAEEFLKLSLRERIDFIKKILAVPEDEDSEEDEAPSTDSARAKALRFLNSLELALHSHMSKGIFDTKCFEHIFKVREILRMPGSSLKSLMESVALVTPTF